MACLIFPALGSERTVPLYVAPEGPASEELSVAEQIWHERKGLTITCRLVSREKARSWSLRFAAIQALEEKRKRLPGVNLSVEGFAEIIALQREILADALVRVSGIQVGAVLLETEPDTTRVIGLLEDIDHLSLAAQAVIRAQAPTAEQRKL